MKYLIALNLVVSVVSILGLFYIKDARKETFTSEQRERINSNKIMLIETTNDIDIIRKEYLKAVDVYKSSTDLNDSYYELILTLINLLIAIAVANLVIISVTLFESKKKQKDKTIECKTKSH